MAQNFPRLRPAQMGFAFEPVLLRPESATLAVTIIPVSLAVGVGTPGHDGGPTRGVGRCVDSDDMESASGNEGDDGPGSKEMPPTESDMESGQE